MNKQKPCCSDLAAVLDPALFKALCDPTRLTILARVAQSCATVTVSDVASCCPIDLSVVSRHLATLRNAGIVRAVRKGKEVHYSVQAGALARTLRRIADAIERCCPEQLEESDARRK